MADCSAATDSQLPPAKQCVFPAMLESQALRRSSQTLVMFEDDSVWTYSQAHTEARKAAAALQALGITRGEPVLVWLPNSPEIIRIHFGLCYMGGIFVPINIALKGKTLEYIITNTSAKIIICHSDLARRLMEVNLGKLERIIIIDAPGEESLGLTYVPQSALAAKEIDFDEPSPPIQPWEPHAIFYTSGTTGRSKGVITPHVHTAVHARCTLRCLTENDRFLVNLPYSHLGGAIVPFAVVGCGASMALVKQFRTQTFWREIDRTGSTSCFLTGAMTTFLMKEPEQSNDRNHSLRTAIQQPLVTPTAFFKRFGVTIYTQHDMTEAPAFIMSSPITTEEKANGYCGREEIVLPRFEARLVDENDCEVTTGDVGELVIRSAMPHVLAPGYWGNPEATAEAWRNGWFHTGDAFRKDHYGDYFFIDRKKDAIRRRGENISSAEVEMELLAHEDIADAAAVATKSEFGEDEVLAVVELKEGHTLEPYDLLVYLLPRMPHFMVPRYIRMISKMPYTETHKIQKARLRDEGIMASGVWDREKAGLQVKRANIG